MNGGGTLSCFSAWIYLYPFVIHPWVVFLQCLDTLVSFCDTPLSGVYGSAFSFARHLSIQVPTNGVHGLHSGLLLCCCNQTWREEDIFQLTSYSSTMREAEAGSEAGATEGCCLLACSPWLAQLFSSTARDHLPSGFINSRSLFGLPFWRLRGSRTWQQHLARASVLPSNITEGPTGSCNGMTH